MLQLHLRRPAAGQPFMWTFPNGTTSEVEFFHRRDSLGMFSIVFFSIVFQFNRNSQGVKWKSGEPNYNGAGYVGMGRDDRIRDYNPSISDPVEEWPRNSLCMWEGFCDAGVDVGQFQTATVAYDDDRTPSGFRIGTKATVRGSKPQPL